MPPPPTLSLAFQGKLRDKVGASPTAFSPDGALDGTFRVTVEAGSGPRTVTRLELRRNGGGHLGYRPGHVVLGSGGRGRPRQRAPEQRQRRRQLAVADGSPSMSSAPTCNPSLYTSGTSSR